MIKVALIVAAARNGVIGCDNRLPWHLPEDLRYFKATTLGKPVIMGRKTWDSIGRPLPGRPNIVVTRQQDWPAPEGVWVAPGVPEAVALARELPEASAQGEVIVMGGAEIYRQALPLTDRVYLTRVAATPEGDAWFPELAPSDWRLVSEQPGSPQAVLEHQFLVFERQKLSEADRSLKP